MTHAEHPSVVNTWHWKAVGAPPTVRPPMSPKVKALIQAPIMVIIAWLIHRHTGHRIMPGILVGLAALVLIGGLAVPPIFRAFENFGLLLTRWVAGGLTWGLLVPFFYIVFGLGRVLLIVTRQDPMHLQFPAPDCTTFWEARPPVRSLDQYRRQH